MSKARKPSKSKGFAGLYLALGEIGWYNYTKIWSACSCDALPICMHIIIMLNCFCMASLYFMVQYHKNTFERLSSCFD
jgi:D-alanyl-lipoteichoic acid acyltransferase DltB (MBOAT superfamily)